MAKRNNGRTPAFWAGFRAARNPLEDFTNPYRNRGEEVSYQEWEWGWVWGKTHPAVRLLKLIACRLSLHRQVDREWTTPYGLAGGYWTGCERCGHEESGSNR